MIKASKFGYFMILSHIRKKLRRYFNKKPYRPVFNDDYFLSNLGISQDQMKSIKDKTDYSTRVSALADCFCTANSSRFFLTTEELSDRIRFIKEHHKGWADETVNTALDILANKLAIYNQKHTLQGDINWNDFSYINNEDILYRLKPHRFAFTIQLALADHYGTHTLDHLGHLVSTWIRDIHAKTRPVGYFSNLVAVYRSIALSWTHQILKASSKRDKVLEFKILLIILNDAKFVSHNLWKSYPNNHLLADGFFLWYLGTIYPEFHEASKWRSRGEKLWLREFKRQIYTDGCSFEHSLHYHELACEMATAYYLLKNRNGEFIPDWFTKRFHQMLGFQSSIGGPYSLTFNIGDATEDPLFPLDPSENAHPDLWALIRASIFGTTAQCQQAHRSSRQRAFWLTGYHAGENLLAKFQTKIESYPDGGFYTFTDSELQSHLVFRSGPKKNLHLCAGHMHSDLLTIYFSVKGTPVFTEPGTFTYRSKKAISPNHGQSWRHHFLGPDCHSGLSISSTDDPISNCVSDFRDKSINSWVVEHAHKAAKNIGFTEVEHKGDHIYNGHHRGIITIFGHYTVIYDLIPDQIRDTEINFNFQLSHGLNTVINDSRQVIIQNSDTTVSLISSDSIDKIEVFEGQMNPPRGWVSPHYGELLPAPFLQYTAGRNRNAFAFLVDCEGSLKNASIQIDVIDSKPLSDKTLCIVITESDRIDYIIINRDSAAKKVQFQKIEFDGALLWLQTVADKATSLRWISGRSMVFQDKYKITSPSYLDELEIRTAKDGTAISPQGLDRELNINWAER